jgi:hypothetical protein
VNRICLIVLCACLLCACAPSSEQIEANVTKQLQQKISDRFGTGSGVEVKSIVVVREDGNKYQGVADVAALGSHLPLKLAILADRKNVIYEASGTDWAAFVASVYQIRLKPLDGGLSDVVADDKSILGVFPVALRKEQAKFSERLEVRFDIESIGPYWFGHGCKAHSCTFDGAAWAINRETGGAYAIIETTDYSGSTLTKHFDVYGGQIVDLPRPLLEWAVTDGMNPYNSAVIP